MHTVVYAQLARINKRCHRWNVYNAGSQVVLQIFNYSACLLSLVLHPFRCP
jgi:hypothetical protein